MCKYIQKCTNIYVYILVLIILYKQPTTKIENYIFFIPIIHMNKDNKNCGGDSRRISNQREENMTCSLAPSNPHLKLALTHKSELETWVSCS